jgi:hypothetical protein
LFPHKSVCINNNYPLHPPISLLVKQTQLYKLRVAHQSTMSPVLVNNQGQCCLYETKLVATSRLGLPHQLPHGLKDLTLEGKPLHLKVQKVKKQQQIDCARGNKSPLLPMAYPTRQLHPTPHQKTLPMEGLVDAVTRWRLAVDGCYRHGRH